MSILIKKQGLQDTIQDGGRYGYQHLGINPGGAMDTAAMRIANALVGNHANEPVIEMHFPAAELLFEEAGLIALSGADFEAAINEQPVAVHQPLLVQKGSILSFHKQLTGARIYLAVNGGWRASKWLGSYSTNLEVKAGGINGKALHKGDRVFMKKVQEYTPSPESGSFVLFPWRANTSFIYHREPVRIIVGAEYDRLHQLSQQQLTCEPFFIHGQSNRMGYRLASMPLQTIITSEMISTAVTRGTIQLLPDGQLIILMADHQTTGGYPRVAHVISTDMPVLAQKKTGQHISFQTIDYTTAEQYGVEYERNLRQLENACNFRLQEYVSK